MNPRALLLPLLLCCPAAPGLAADPEAPVPAPAPLQVPVQPPARDGLPILRTPRSPGLPPPGVVVPPGEPGPLDLAVNPASRRSSRAFFNTVYNASESVPHDWDGNVTTGAPGSTSQAFRDAVALRVNWFRAMAGLPGNITFRDEWNAACQQAALMMSANNRLDHYPNPGWMHYTESGKDAAGASNLNLNVFGPASVTNYMEDPGPGNMDVGHRRWVLYPPTRQMGTGDVPASGGKPAANALWIFDGATQRPSPRDGFVAWPPPGYVPYQVIYPRWSFSIPGADFSAATVSVTRNGSPVGTLIESRSANYGDRAIVWHLSGRPDGSGPLLRPIADLAHVVRIGNVLIGGEARQFEYTVRVFDPAFPGMDEAPAPISGPASVPPESLAIFTVPENPDASRYEWLSARSQPVNWIEGAETPGNLRLTPFVTGGYDVINTSELPGRAFHLRHGTPESQFLTLNGRFLATPTSEIRFRSRYGFMTPTQVAAVEVSTDDGTSWLRVFSRPGTGVDAGWRPEEKAELRDFAGGIIRIRFHFAYEGGAYFPMTDLPNVGWHVDDIRPVNLAEVTEAEALVTTTPALVLPTPSEPGTRLLTARGLMFDRFPLDFSPVVTFAIDPSSAPVAATLSLAAEPLEGGQVGGGGVFPIGTVAEVEALPAEGYAFVGWQAEGLSLPEEPSVELAMTGDFSIVARFEPIVIIPPEAPRLAGFRHEAADGSFAIRFHSQPGTRYRLQTSPDLDPQSWIDVPDLEIIGDGGELELSGSLEPGEGRAFFRIVAGP